MKICEYEKNIYEKTSEIPHKLRIELGKYIRMLREEKNISIGQLADLTNINIADLHKIEHGTKNRVNPFQLKAISRILQVDYKIFYKMVNFLDEKDFSEGLVVEREYSRKELLYILSMYYPRIDLKYLLETLETFSPNQIRDVFLFIDFIRTKNNI